MEVTWTAEGTGAAWFQLEFEKPFGALAGYLWSPDNGKRKMYRTYIMAFTQTGFLLSWLPYAEATHYYYYYYLMDEGLKISQAK